jgi:cytochrome P450
VSLASELEDFGSKVGADVERFVREGKQELEQHVQQHPQPLFALLRALRPVLLIHDMAIVTRYVDVVAVLTNDESFSVQPYKAKMRALAGDFILGLDDSPEYERDISILRLAAPRSDVPSLAGFVAATAEQLVAEAAAQGYIEVPDLAKRVPARLIGRWLGTPGPDEDSLIAWTLAMFEDIFVNVKDDPQVHRAAEHAAAQMRPYLEGVITERKRRGREGGQNDVLGRLLAMQEDRATSLSDERIATNLIGLLVGFVPTVASATTFAIDKLLDLPEALATARRAARADDDDAVRAHMWEAMRLAPQGPGLIRRAQVDCVAGEGTHHATLVPAGTLTFAATQSAMLDGDVIEDPHDFRPGRPSRHYLHFGAGLHQCFGRFANAMQLPLIAKALLRQPNLARAPGAAGLLVKSGPYPKSLRVTIEH